MASIIHDDNDEKAIYKEAFIGMAAHRGLHLCNTGEICTVVIDNGISGLLCHDGVSAVRPFKVWMLEYRINQRDCVGTL